MTRIFISYARADDEAFVKQLYNDLATHGFTVWWDRISLPTRQLTFHQEIKDAIRLKSDRLVYVGGPQAALSDYVREEWRFALEIDLPVIPILRKGDYACIPNELALVHCEDFREDSSYSIAIAKLINNLTSLPPPLGRLIGVPRLPPYFVHRPDLLLAVKASVLVDLRQLLVREDARTKIGVHGMSGIGKSVFASALGRDREVRRAFPDGIIWLSIGKEPNVLRLQRILVQYLGCRKTFDNEAYGKSIIQEILAVKAILVIFDNVWKASDLEMLDAFGPRCRALITTQNSGILHALHAEAIPVALLSEVEALNLLADTAGIPLAELPAAAGQVADECGYLPLAIALCGGMAKKRDGEWAGILRRLRLADLEKIADRESINEDHRSIWRAMQVSVGALSPEERRRFAELAVFAATDHSVPIAAIRTLWSYTGGIDDLAVEDLLISLSERSLLRLERTSQSEKTSGWSLFLHELLHDFASRIAAEPIVLHQTLLNAYRELCPNGWPSGPDDGYFLQKLASHLSRADRAKELSKLLFDFAWLQTKTERALINELLQDYDEAKGTFAIDSPKWNVLNLIQNGIRLSADVLSVSRVQLASQFTGRMGRFADVEVIGLMDSAKRWRGSPWLLALNCNLHPPGTALLYTLTGHSNVVNSVASSSDFHHAISACDDGTLKVWDLEARTELRTLSGHTKSVRSVVASSDFRHAISASDDRSLKIWDIETGQELYSLIGHRDDITLVVASCDFGRAVSASNDGTFKVWDIQKGEELLSIATNHDYVASRSIAVSPDLRYAIINTMEGALQIWDLQTGKVLYSKDPACDLGNVNIVSADSSSVISSLYNGKLEVWNLETGKKLRTLGEHGRLLRVTADFRTAFSSTRAHETISVWDIETEKTECNLVGHGGPVTAIDVDSNCHRAISSSWDHTLKVWDLRPDLKPYIPIGHGNRVTSLAVSRDYCHALSASEDGTLIIWDLETGTEKQAPIKCQGRIESVVLSSDSRFALYAANDYGNYRALAVLDLASHKRVCDLVGHAGIITSVAADENFSRAISGSTDRLLKIWDLGTGRELHSLDGHKGEVTAIAVSRDFNRALSASNDKTLKIWDLQTGNEIYTLTGLNSFHAKVAVSADFRRAISSSWNSMQIWDLENRRELLPFGEHSSDIGSVAVTDSFHRVLSGSRDRSLRIWDTKICASIATFSGESAITACAFSSMDASSIIAGESSGRIHFLRLIMPDP